MSLEVMRVIKEPECVVPGDVGIKEEVESSEIAECAEQELQSVKQEPVEESSEAGTLCGDPAINVSHLGEVERDEVGAAEQELTCVKQELAEEELLDGVDTLCVSVKTELYAEHAVTDELVLGPERVQLRVGAPCSSVVTPPPPPPRPRARPRAGGSQAEEGARAGDYDRDPVCALCGRRFARKADLMRHVAVHIHTQGEGESESGFGDNASLGVSLLLARSCSVRLERCARAAAAALPGAAYQCDTCGQTCTRKHLLIRHINTHLRNQADVHNKPRTNVRSDTSTSSSKSKLKKKHGRKTCEICNKTYSSTSTLRVHTLIHIGRKPYSCEICKKEFYLLDTLRRHQIVHMPKPNCNETRVNSLWRFSCEICDKGFTVLASLKVHARVHTGEKPYSCEVCYTKFTQASDLKSHRLIHTGEKPYCCDVCKKTFRKGTDLSRHKRLHSGVKPHYCEICKRGFARLDHLKGHRRTHARENMLQYCCEICKKRFKRSDLLYRHIKKNHSRENVRPYCCKICKKGFRRSDQLKGHIRRNHTRENVRPYCCEICTKGFKRLDQLKGHIQRNHTREKPDSCEV